MSGLLNKNFPIDSIKNIDDVKEILNQILEDTQDRQTDLISETPTTKDVDERELKIVNTGGTVQLITKINGVLYGITLPAI